MIAPTIRRNAKIALTISREIIQILFKTGSMGRTFPAMFSPNIKSGFRTFCTIPSTSQLSTVKTSNNVPKKLETVFPMLDCACAFGIETISEISISTPSTQGMP